MWTALAGYNLVLFIVYSHYYNQCRSSGYAEFFVSIDGVVPDVAQLTCKWDGQLKFVII